MNLKLPGYPWHPAKESLQQFFMPAWAAESIVRLRFGDLSTNDAVVDAGCGRGAFLQALPSDVRAVGVEIDPEMAAFCESATNCQVLIGDFRTTVLPFEPTVILGNPPFSHDLSEGFLERAAELLPINGRCGFVLPGTFLSFSSAVLKWRERFSIVQEALPRDLFPRIAYPLSFYTFTRTRGPRRLHGFLLFDEAAAVKEAPESARLALVGGRPHRSAWRTAVQEAVRALGGVVTLQQLYRYLQGNLPWYIKTWKDTIRRILQEGGFVNVGRGRWSFAGA